MIDMEETFIKNIDNIHIYISTLLLFRGTKVKRFENDVVEACPRLNTEDIL